MGDENRMTAFMIWMFTMSIRSITHWPIVIHSKSKMTRNLRRMPFMPAYPIILLHSRVPIFHACIPLYLTLTFCAYSCMNTELDRLVPEPVSVGSKEKRSASTIEVNVGTGMIQIEYGVLESIPPWDELLMFDSVWENILLGMTSSGSAFGWADL